MKRQIRRRVFETNSSSTHSVSIYNSTHRMYKDIPENSKIICDGTWRLGTDIFDEVGKLNYIIILIASIIEDISYSKDMDMGAPFEKND